MCFSCGCFMPDCDHGDARAITTLLLQGAADMINSDVPTVVGNIAKTLAACATKGATGPGVAGVVVKSDAPRRYTLTVAYPANKPDAHVAQDGHRDFASPQAVEEAAWNYLHKSPKVGLWHQTGTDGAGDVVESYVYRGPDWHLTAADGSEQVIKAGDWLMGIRWTPETWPLVEKGLIGGVSPQGRAKRRVPSADAVANLRS